MRSHDQQHRGPITDGSASSQGEPEGVAGGVVGSPRLVPRGEKCAAPPGGSCTGVGIDWIRASGPVEALPAVLGKLVDRFGAFSKGRGRYFLNAGYYFPGGASLLFDDPAWCVGQGPKSHFVVDLPGGFLSVLAADERVAILAELLACGMKGRRLDLAIDWRGEGIDLIERMISSCEAGELCGAKRHDPRRVFSGGELIEHQARIGCRGDAGSGRFLRCYDKGLETKTEPAGRWVRLELELGGECAEVAAAQIAGVEGWERVSVSMVLGAVDFREVTGDRHIDARPRVGWWASLLAGVEAVRVKAKQRASSLAGYAAWLRRAVLGSARTYAEEMGCSVGEFMRWVAGDPEASKSARRTSVMHDLREMLRSAGGDMRATAADLANVVAEGVRVVVQASTPAVVPLLAEAAAMGAEVGNVGLPDAGVFEARRRSLSEAAVLRRGGLLRGATGGERFGGERGRAR